MQRRRSGGCKAATASIPIVFTTGEDPVRQGLVTNLGRPSGNLTGVTFFGGGVLGAKRVELLHGLVPKARAIAVLIDPNYGGSDAELREVEAVGRALGRQIVTVRAAGEQQFEAAFDKLLEAGADALLIAGGANFSSQRQAIITLAARHAMPTMYTSRDYVAAGGLISYSASVANAYRQAGVYAGKILKGTKPSELPVLLPTKFELVINLKTAKALGLTVPLIMQMTADEVIE